PSRSLPTPVIRATHDSRAPDHLRADLTHPTAMPADELRHVEANGLRFAYLEDGRGPLVLLLHGFPDTPRSWDHARPRIAARGYRAVSPWLRGYAPTAIPPRDTDIE